MSMPVIKGASYLLVHTPDMIIQYGTTCSSEHESNPESAFLKKIPAHIRSFDAVVKYAPNQAYIGNILPDTLNDLPKPWYENLMENAADQGKLGIDYG